MVGARRRRHATQRRTPKRNRHSHSVHTTGVSVRTLQVPFRNRPYGAYVLTYNRHVVVLAKR